MRFAARPRTWCICSTWRRQSRCCAAQQARAPQAERRIGAEVMGQLCDGHMSDRDGDQELAERGLAAASCCVVAAEGVSAASERRLHLGLGRRSIPHLLLHRAALLYALMPVTDHTLDVLNQRLDGEAIFGVSDHFLCRRVRRSQCAKRRGRCAWPSRRRARSRGSPTRRSSRYCAIRKRRVSWSTEVLGRLLACSQRIPVSMVVTLDTCCDMSGPWCGPRRARRSPPSRCLPNATRIEEITRTAASAIPPPSPSSGWRYARRGLLYSALSCSSDTSYDAVTPTLRSRGAL